MSSPRFSPNVTQLTLIARALQGPFHNPSVVSDSELTRCAQATGHYDLQSR